MASLVFYDCTETDKRQLTNALNGSEHHCRFIAEPLSMTNFWPDAEVISVFISSPLSAELLAKFPKLKLIACRSTGFDNIDLQAATKRGITVVNVPTYGENTVAEYAFMLILTLSRKLLSAIDAVQTAHIDASALQGFDLHGKTLGIVGAGRIGQQAAKIGLGFGMKVQAYDPLPQLNIAQSVGFNYTDLANLFASSDIITIHAPYTAANHHLINSELLKSVKPGALLINTARGELVDTKALVDALQSKRLAGAGLDVLEGEKMLNLKEELLTLHRNQVPHDVLEQNLELQVLAKLPNVILTPHNAFNTSEAILRINVTTIQNIYSFLQGKPTNVVKVSQPTMGLLMITRHAESEWNAKGLWTGSRDVHLSEKGFHESALLGETIEDIHIDYAYASQQIRAFETLEAMLDVSRQFNVPYERSAALNERDYGDYTGKNKWQMRDLIGEQAFEQLRRDWDYPVPHGETLKQVYARSVPFYLNSVLPRLKAGQNVLLVAHGNSIRSLMKYIENISDTDIAKVEMPFGNVLIYHVDEAGRQKHKDERRIDSPPPPA